MVVEPLQRAVLVLEVLQHVEQADHVVAVAQRIGDSAVVDADARIAHAAILERRRVNLHAVHGAIVLQHPQVGAGAAADLKDLALAVLAQEPVQQAAQDLAPRHPPPMRGGPLRIEFGRRDDHRRSPGA